ncbi:cytoskeletal protein-binding protein SLA1 [Sugiyamaella lignohabitans]|uniref:Cytoskeletal protein-binding protein SLA1 n=1 Tax=Sugiyamaella lignohabitans TaxID=796027 RepID=A0A167EQ00_9ASCO|nr:cytoskeletal protein-binding protein SLA1 [Sugiyamaella lignohabitans]ANB14326.1 cytoskeletal protein-binding protein SLA1 [Sugiyamaella lignohabitans]
MNKVRTWTDRSGTFKVDAALLGCADGKIHLHKLNGVKIAVAASKMSIEDLEYVESVTGVVLDDDKPLVDLRKGARSRRTKSNGGSPMTGVPGGVSTGDGSSSGQAAGRSSSTTSVPTRSQMGGGSANGAATQQKPEFDWFGFFLECGVDVNNCQRYALNFTRDQMDENILPDISPQVLRNLGLKEGDILRVTKKLDEKFDRKRLNAEATGGLFSGPDGTLKNNTAKDLSNGNVTGVTNAAAVEAQQQPIPRPQQPAATSTTNGFADDAWAVKSQPQTQQQQPPPQPARPQQQQQQPQQQQPQQQQFQLQVPQQMAAPTSVAPQPTGSLLDLMTIQPLEPQKTAQSVIAEQQQKQAHQQRQLQQQQQIQQQQQQIQQLQQQLQKQQTGSATMLPQLTGGATVVPTVVQGPNGPILTQQRTGGGTLIPLTNSLTGQSINSPLGPFATGNAQQITGFGPVSTGFQQPIFTANQPISNPSTPFNQPFGFASQPQASFSSPSLSTITNQLQQTHLTGSQPQLVNPQLSNPQLSAPQLNNPFNQQTGVFQPNFASPFPPQQQQPQPQQPLQPFATQPQPQLQQFQPQQPFQQFQPQQPQQLFQPQQTAFTGGNPFDAQQQPIQPLQGQPTGFGFGNSASTINGFGGPAAQTLGNSFSSQQAYPTLQPQKTGPPPPVSFGGGPAPLQPTNTGRRANLAAATPNNPFGF